MRPFLLLLKASPSSKKAFSLAELVAALAIVGVVAALTVPSVLTGVKREQNKTKLKNAITLIENVAYQGLTNGEADGYDVMSVVTYIMDHVDARTKCYTASEAEGCGSRWNRYPSNGDNAQGLVLHDGTEILFQGWFDWTGGRFYTQVFTEKYTVVYGPSPNIDAHHSVIITNPLGAVDGSGNVIGHVGQYLKRDPYYTPDASALFSKDV
jgi:prepilin-type N-terminal cleavage/methylation domain-containing protein